MSWTTPRSRSSVEIVSQALTQARMRRRFSASCCSVGDSAFEEETRKCGASTGFVVWLTRFVLSKLMRQPYLVRFLSAKPALPIDLEHDVIVERRDLRGISDLRSQI